MDDMPKVQKLETGKYYVTFDVPFEANIFAGLCKYHSINNTENPDMYYMSGDNRSVQIETSESFLWNVLRPQIRYIIETVKNYIYVEHLGGKVYGPHLLEEMIKEIPNILIKTYKISNIVYC